MRTRRRRGLGLVEVVTGTGVLLMLVALQIPAIQEARERARVSQCTNNLKQIALATMNYESAWGSFPMSAVAGPGHGVGHGYFVSILPFQEQSPLYNAYNFSLENWDRANSTVTCVMVNTYLCPSNPTKTITDAADVRTHNGRPYPGTSKFAPSHYAANWGGVRSASGDAAYKAYKGSHQGLILTVVDPDAAVKTRNLKVADVTDGMSYTLMGGEKLDGFGWLVSGWGGTEFDVNTSPSYTGEDAKLRRVFTGSMHTDGKARFMMADGSVHSLKPDLQRSVWYALTTRAGNETVKLDD